MNYKIPDWYLVNHILAANTENDYLLLDRVLDCIDELVKITIFVKPTDISALIHDHAAYITSLGSINNRWDLENEDFNPIDYFGPESSRYIETKNQLKPLTYRDHLSGRIMQDETKIHKRLYNRHLYFVIKAEAKSNSTVPLVASVLGECGFKDDSYHIILSDGALDSDLNSRNTECRLFDESGQAEGKISLNEYVKLRDFRHIAGVDELCGIFRLPVGSYFSPCCIRKNTDPVQQVLEDLMVIGYDMETGGATGLISGQPRGISYHQMIKHLFISGLPGSGKTTAVMSVLLQLSCGNVFSRIDDRI